MNENTPTPEEAGAATSSVIKFQCKDSKNIRHEQIAELIFLMPIKRTLHHRGILSILLISEPT